ncbi:MAG: UvrD-helicase domain-containing protein [Elusimicrobiota bacterium]
MLPSEIKITNADIDYAAKILLSAGEGFDAEAIEFIKNLETIDLHAVPGSGKTTALLAKLLILDKFLPFDDGSGILVLSHTNAAIDEIKKQIKSNCPKLFSYPNFVGTIQSFVDHFLAIPAYCNEFHKKPVVIDFSAYQNKIISCFYSQFPANLRTGVLMKFGNDKNATKEFISSYRFGKDRCLIADIINLSKKFLWQTATQTYTELKQMKETVMASGILCYDDAYSLANDYLDKHSVLGKFLQNRFSLVFIDEMQDMEKHQHDLLEKLFYGDVTIETIYQRIGDPNQAIYGNKVKAETVWKPRKKVLPLKGSHRLSKPIAAIVQNFGLNYIEIEGKNTGLIKPIIITYTDVTIQTVIPTFAQIIKRTLLPTPLKDPCKAIAWVAKEKGDTAKITLPDYFPQYNKLTKISKREVFDSLQDALLYARTKAVRDKNLNCLSRTIVNIMSQLAVTENIAIDGNTSTKSSLLDYLRKHHPDKFGEFEINIFKWSQVLYESFSDTMCQAISAYFKTLFENVFKNKLPLSKQFLDGLLSVSVPPLSDGMSTTNDTNIYKDGNVSIEIGTIHSVKGETHTATLYLESSYFKCETEKILKVFYGEQLTVSEKVGRKAETAKMAYVAMSRPTHLLCFACKKDHITGHENDLKNNGWDIIDIN